MKMKKKGKKPQNGRDFLLKMFEEHSPEWDNIRFTPSESWASPGKHFDDWDNDIGKEVIDLFGSRENGLNRVIVFIAEHLGERSEDDLLKIINFSGKMKKSFWHLEAMAIAELAARFPKAKGGRGKIVKAQDSREKHYQEMAKKIKIGITKIREAVRMIEVFGEVQEFPIVDKKTPTPAAGVLPVKKQTYFEGSKKDENNEGYFDTVVNIDPERNVRRLTTFDPRGLPVGFYKAAAKFTKNKHYAKLAINHAVKEREKKSDYSVADFERWIDPKLNAHDRAIGFKPNLEFESLKIELNLSREQAKIFDHLIKLELGFSLLFPKNIDADKHNEARQRATDILIDAIKFRIDHKENGIA